MTGSGHTQWAVEDWSGEAAAQTEYAAYWNDAEAERGKPFDVVEQEDLSGMEQYLDDVGLSGDLRAALAAMDAPIGGTGIDVAAGTLWAARDLLSAGPVERLYCLEFSRHRLLEIGPHVLERHGVEPDRVVLAYGSFYDLHLPDGSLDFAFLSQALHHADRPEALLGQLRRVLRPGGSVIVIGEHRTALRLYALYVAKAALWFLPDGVSRRVPAQPLARRPRLRPAGADLEPPDPVLGDHFYTGAEYRAMFDATGFSARRLRRRESPYQSFILTRDP